MKKPSYIDPWLIVFLILMCVASIIAAHGAYVFFCYLLEPGIAVLATVVTAAGIPALDVAGTLEQKKSRAALYWLGAFTFLGMETLANYFSGQAIFLANVLQAFAGKEGADLVWLARQPAGRVLVVVYLAMPSLIVAYFAYAAASRWRTIREARAVFAKDGRSRARTARRLRGLRRMARELQTEIASARAKLEEGLRVARDSAAEQARLSQQDRERAADLKRQLAESQQAVRELSAEAASLRVQVQAPFDLPASEPPTRARIVAYVREQLAAGRSQLDIARELDIADATLRGWLKQIDGHVIVINGNGH